MPRYAQIDGDGVVVVVSDLSGEIDAPHMILIADGEDRLGWKLEAGEWHEPPPPEERVPAEISDRQFAQILAMLGIITEEEAIAWAARGDLPVALQNAVTALPVEQRFPAKMLLSSATVYERNHPMVPMLATILDYNSEELDALWRAAAQL